MIKQNFLIYSFLVIITLLAISAWLTKKDSIYQYEYITTFIDEEDELSYLSFQSKLIDRSLIPQFARSQGVVTSIKVDLGDEVNIGDVLAVLDGEDQILEDYLVLLKERKILTKGIDLEIEDKEFKRLHRIGFYSDSDLRRHRQDIIRFKNTLTSFDRKIDELKRKIKEKVILSTTSGTVSQLNISLGDKLGLDQMNMPIVYVQSNIEDWGLEIQVPGNMRGYVKAGQRVEFKIHGQNKGKVVGEVVNIDQVKTLSRPGGNEIIERGFFKAKARIDRDSKLYPGLKSGLNILVNIVLRENDHMTWIPRSAFDILFSKNEISTVLDYSEHIYKKIAPQLAETELKKQVEIEQGVLARSVASESFPKESSVNDLYILAGDSSVIRVLVPVLAENKDYIAIPRNLLKNARVIVHYRKKLSL
jgi:hypothetical protein